MKKRNLFLVTLFLCISMVKNMPVHAEEIEVLRGEEVETEIYLKGSEEIYSMYGELEFTEAFLRLKEQQQENSANYQALKQEEAGAKFLLSNRGYDGNGLWLHLRIEGVRIGTGTIRIRNSQITGGTGDWLQNVEIPEIAVKVLPHPLLIEADGVMGNDGWYTEPVTVRISDMDAAQLWYDYGDGRISYSGPFTVKDGVTLLYAVSDDGYGYIKQEERRICVDTTVPVLTVSPRESVWQQNRIEIKVEAGDHTSGLAYTEWSFSESRENGGEWRPLTEDVVPAVDADGIWYLHLRAEDKAGNKVSTVYGPYQKDSAQPVIGFENLYQDLLVENGITPEVTVTDSGAGIKEITYLLDGQEWMISEVVGRGRHILTVTAEDFAGNIRTETVEFVVYDSIQVTAEAGKSKYTGTASFSALVLHQGKALPEAEAEFLLNGESVGKAYTNQEGRASVQIPMELSPQMAELTVRVAQDEKRFLLAGEDTTRFKVEPEHAWLLYGGDYSVWNKEALRIYVETGEFPDNSMGDMTRAELLVRLCRIEKDGSKTFMEEACLYPDKRGVVTHEFYPDTGLYELTIDFTENSCYTGKSIVLHPAVFDIDAELELEGGSLLLDLPHLGVYMKLVFTFLPPTLEAEIEVRIPGTGIVLTENRITDYDVTMDGIILYGRAVNPADGTVYSYEVRSSYAMGFLLDELETSLWKGEDKTQEPVYHFEWR